MRSAPAGCTGLFIFAQRVARHNDCKGRAEMLMRRKMICFTSMMIALALPAGLRAASLTDVAATQISVSAEAVVEAAPDYAEMRVGVVTQAPQAKAALESNAAHMARVRKALGQAGISARDIQTSQMMLQPQYRYAENQPPAIIGYQATQQLRLISRNLSQTGPLLDLLVAQGVNQIDGPSFGVSNMEQISDQARLAAFAQAQQRLALYAKAAGLKIKRLIDISESTSEPLHPLATMRMLASDKRGAPSEIVAGTMAVRASVTLRAELE